MSKFGTHRLKHLQNRVHCKRNFSSVKDAQTQKKIQLPESADVVIIGGGSIGCNTLYQLAKRGVSGILLEKHRLTAGTTWHTAGLIWRLRPNDVEIELLKSTRNLLMRLEEETSINPGWINNGGLYIAHSKERLDEYRRLATIGRGMGIESYILNPSETVERFPFIDVNQIIGGLYCPGDGVVDPDGLCNALTRFATSAGAKVYEGCSADEILLEQSSFGSRKVVGVKTLHGTVKTSCVVNCSGVWSQHITKSIGIDIPLIPMKHAYVVTEGIPGVQGLPNVRDHDFSVYFRIQGSSFCVGGYENNPVLLDKVEKEFAFGLYDLDWDVFNANMEGAVKLVPEFGRAGIKSTVCGPESFTPDHKPLLGEDPDVRGFYHGCGFNSSGMMLGGGCGEQLALWVIHGRPELDMFNYDIRRFCPEQKRNLQWAKERSHESYAKNYSIVFPHDEPLAGRNLRFSPIHQVLQNAGCIFQERLGWERAGWFSTDGPAPLEKYDWYGAYNEPLNHSQYKKELRKDYTFDFPVNHKEIGEECLSCRNQVAIFDMSYFGKFYLTGKDAQHAANWLFSGNTERSPGSTIYTCMLSKRGGVEGDLTVSVLESGDGGAASPNFQGLGFYVAVGGGSAEHCWAHIKSEIQKKGFHVELSDKSEEMGLISIQGPNSLKLLEPLMDTDLNNDSFPFSTHKMVKVAGYPCRAVRLSFVGELGWELHIPRQYCLPIYNAIWLEGQKHGLRNAGYRALDSLSLEKGFHLWHMDVRPDDNPFEAKLGFTCRKDGDYLGKEAVDSIRNQGLHKRLALLSIDSHIPLWGLETIWRDDVVVGYLRRGDYGFAINKSIGHGYIRHPSGTPVTTEFLKNGHYQLEVLGTRYDATIHLQRPFDPKNKRVQGIYDE